MKNLTAVYWIKDEARYLPEYIEFHLLQGFDHFIFYDNDSKDNLLEVVEPYISEGIVEIRKYPPYVPYGKTFWVINTCIEEQKGKTKWLHFHAIDERLFCPNGERVSDYLEKMEAYPGCGGVAVSWVLFSGNGHMTRQDGLIIDDPMEHVKTVIRPDYTITHGGDPHCFKYVDDYRAIDENYTDCPIAFNHGKNTHKKIQLSHYATLSYQECQEKMNKGVLDTLSLEHGRRYYADWYWEYMGAPKKDVPVYNVTNGQTNTVRNIYYDNELSAKYSKTIKENLISRYSHRQDLLTYINH